MAGAGHAVHLRDQRRGTDEGVEQRELVRHRGEAVELDERVGDGSRELGLAAHEHAFPRHEHVVEHGEGLEHLVLRRDGELERVVVAGAVRRHVQGEPRGVDRGRERDRVVGVVGAHRPRGQHDDLVRVRADAGVALRAADDDAVGALLDDVDVEVGIGLRVRREGAVTLDVGLRDRDRQIVVAAVLVVGDGPLARLALEHPEQAEQRVGADLLHQRHHRATEAGDRLDQPRARQQVVRRVGDRVVRAVFAPGVGILRHRKVAIERVVPDLVVERGVVDRDTEVGLLEDVGHPPPAVPEGATVAERGAVLIGGRQAHRGTLDGGHKLTR